MKLLSRCLLLGTAALMAVTPAQAKPSTIKIKLATLAPDGSTWHELLKDLAADWARVSDGRVELRIYAGGVAGDEPQVMKKMGINTYNAALVTSQGLSSINRSARVFTIPRMLRTNEELDKAMDIMTPELGKRLEEKGYIVLAWADAGWVKFFVPTPDANVDDIRKAKLFSWAGDSEGLQLWRSAGFNVVPLPATELLTGLQTNLVNAFDTMPYYALASQAFRHTPYMIDMKWAPLPGALIMTKVTWDKIPDDLKPALRAEADKFAQRFRVETRKMDDEAVTAMEERGLKVVEPTPAQVDQWDAAVKAAYSDIRGLYVSDEDFDWLQKIVKEIRGENP
jgi:TRAP-type C4-dicarboxylate transport system substrate-binding protein